MYKTVFITGGSRGIGACAVKKFAKSGYRVAFSYLNSEKEAKILENKYGALAVKADISDSEQVDKAIEKIEKAFGSVDILVNNAGIDEFALVTDITDEMWKKMIDTNLSGAFYACRRVLPSMIHKKDGIIINISSMWGEVGASCEVHYSVSKAGLIGLTKALAKEVGPSGIRVNCITPGVVDTDMNKNLTGDDVKSLISDTPLGKIASPEDIVGVMEFLASDSSSFITGQIIGVNGGFII